MRTILLLIILFIIIIIIFTYKKELFEPISSNQYTTWEQDYKSEPTYYSQLDYKNVQKISCCLVEKKFLPSPDDLYEGNFKYVFTKKTGLDCDLSKYDLNSNKQILIEGDNGWSNQYCSNSAGPKQIGSCRNINKECIDFVDKNFCNKYRMKWSNKTCHQPLEFTWVDPINLNLPDLNSGDGTFKLF